MWNSTLQRVWELLIGGYAARMDEKILLSATPGLMTFFDHALFRAVEGEITATICASHALLEAWLALRDQARVVLGSSLTASLPAKLETFVRACLDATIDAIEKLSTDKLASSANLSDAYDHNNNSTSLSSSSSSSSAVLAAEISIPESTQDTGRRHLVNDQLPRDCWETPRLICPDSVWAEDAFMTCQRLLRHLIKLSVSYTAPPLTDYGGGSDHHNEYYEVDLLLHQQQQQLERNVKLLLTLLRQDLAVRLGQFRKAVDANAAVIQRLYLVKCEVRAPFRSFLEAHQNLQRAPSLEVVQSYYDNTLAAASNSGGGGGGGGGSSSRRKQNSNQQSSSNNSNNDAKEALQDLLETPELGEALAIQKELDTLESNMAHALFGFCELGRWLDHKRAKLRKSSLVGVSATNDGDDDNDEEDAEEDYPLLIETLKRLKYCLCRKSGPETSTGIRPILLDVQGVVARDDEPQHVPADRLVTLEDRVDEFLRRLGILVKVCLKPKSFVQDKARGSSELDLPNAIIRDCKKLDIEMWKAEFLDWIGLCKTQQGMFADDASVLRNLGEEIRKAEMEASIAAASTSRKQSLGVVRERLMKIAEDRQKRFDVLQQMMQEVCWRELNLVGIQLAAPPLDVPLELPASTSVLGLLGLPLLKAGEKLPIG